MISVRDRNFFHSIKHYPPAPIKHRLLLNARVWRCQSTSMYSFTLSDSPSDYCLISGLVGVPTQRVNGSLKHPLSSGSVTVYASRDDWRQPDTFTYYIPPRPDENWHRYIANFNPILGIKNGAGDRSNSCTNVVDGERNALAEYSNVFLRVIKFKWIWGGYRKTR